MIKRRMIQGLLILALLCGAVLLTHPSAAWAMEGRGTQEAPYQISTAADLQEFANLVNSDNRDACAVLMGDIVLNTGLDQTKFAVNDDGALTYDGSSEISFTQWTPIGNDYGYRYTGTFDGKGHTISGLYINSNARYAGLFGCIGSDGTVKNLTLSDSYINSHINGGSGIFVYVGGICGQNVGGRITNCSNSGTVDVSGGAYTYVGGICGYNYGTITTCSNSSSVKGNGNIATVGGICGWNNGGSGVKGGIITNCSNSGVVTGSGEVGGICGQNGSDGTIMNCYWLDSTAGIDVGGGNGTNEKVESKTDDQYASGEVAWLLNEQSPNGPWRQNLSGPDKDEFPTLDPTHGVVSSTGYGMYHNCERYDDNGFCTICGSYEPAVQDASGTYQIENAGQLYWFAGLVNGTFLGVDQDLGAKAVLTTDITINSNVLDENGDVNSGSFTQWTPIGDNNNRYTGTFDGAGYEISGLYINSNAGYVGLFGCIGSSGTVKNLTLTGSYISGGSYVGGICGRNYGGSIENCDNSGVVTGSGEVGGICGTNWSGIITNCSNSGTVTVSGTYVGGICGSNNGGRIENCSNSGTVTVSGTYVGGICGFNDGGSITSCSNSGNVSGPVTGNTNVGGICGGNYGTITTCYWLEGTAGAGVGSGDGTVTAKTDEQFASGQVAWLLNEENTSGPWRQNLSGNDKDEFPTLDQTHDVVVQLIFYANTDKEEDNSIVYGNAGSALPNVTLPEITGYTFGGWYEDEALSGKPETAIPDDATGAKTYYAKWTANTYTVTLHAKGGTIADGKGVTNYTYGTETTLPTDVTRAGYTFGGWYENEALSGEPETVIPADATGDKEYWAKWTAKSYPSTPSVIPPTVSEETTDAIADAQPGETVTVDLSGGSTKLDKDVFEALAGKDVTLVVDLEDGVSWTVNGSDIPEDADFTDIDMGVTMNSDGIPLDIINAITGEHGSVQVELAHNGAFGFTMTLTAPLGAENAGYWANLYHFNEDANAMTFETAAQIGDDGSVSLALSHASQYALVIDDHNHGIVTLPFTDVSEGDWFYDPVCYVYSQGLMTGTSATTFEPNTSLSRAMLVAVLHRLEGSPAASAGDFTDVASGDWYAQAVNWSASVGVVNGFDDGTFQPNAAITREQLAAILRNYAAYKGLDVTAVGELSTYTDANSVSAWAKDSVEWVVGSGLLGGYEDNTLRPQGTTTRAEVASVLQRYLEK